jgi:hypothetical protein
VVCGEKACLLHKPEKAVARRLKPIKTSHCSAPATHLLADSVSAENSMKICGLNCG